MPTESTQIAVLVAVCGSVEPVLVQSLSAAHSRISVTRRVAEVVELCAAANAGLGHVAVVSSDLPGLDREVVQSLRAATIAVVGVATTPEAANWLGQLGVLHVLTTEQLRKEPKLAIEAIKAAVAAMADAASTDISRASLPVTTSARGRVVTVWGSTGAPGRTTIAIELAHALTGISHRSSIRRGFGVRRRTSSPALVRAEVILVDADTYGSSCATRLGLLDDAAGLALTALAAREGRLDASTLAAQLVQVSPRLRLLTGLNRAARWPEVSGDQLELILQRATELADWTVVDVAHPIEVDEILMYDTNAPMRNAATLSALSVADVLVVVGAPDPVGMVRLVQALNALAAAPIALSAEPIVAVNRVRAAVAGADPNALVRLALKRFTSITNPELIPDDAATADAALLAGRTMGKTSRHTAVIPAIKALALRVHQHSGAKSGAKD